MFRSFIDVGFRSIQFATLSHNAFFSLVLSEAAKVRDPCSNPWTAPITVVYIRVYTLLSHNFSLCLRIPELPEKISVFNLKSCLKSVATPLTRLLLAYLNIQFVHHIGPHNRAQYEKYSFVAKEVIETSVQTDTFSWVISSRVLSPKTKRDLG